MNILVDTNILLDATLHRDGLYDSSQNAILFALSNSHHLFFSCSSVTDYYYLLRKNKFSKEYSLECIKTIAKYASFAAVDDKCVYHALHSSINDFEDAVVDAVATSINADIILTRNKKDFINSINKVLTPEEYLEKYQ